MSSLLDEITSRDPHLSTGERALSVALGLGLAAAAAKPRPNPLLNLLALVAGAALAYRGASGYCHAKAFLADREHDRRQGGGPSLPTYGRADEGYAPTTAGSGQMMSDYGSGSGTPGRLPEPHGPSIPNSI
jgi:hypothetical protein